MYNCAQISSQMSRSTHTGILPCVRALMTTHSYTSMTYRTQRHVCAHMSICILLTQAHTCTNTYLERLSPLVLHVYICAVTHGEEQCLPVSVSDSWDSERRLVFLLKTIISCLPLLGALGSSHSLLLPWLFPTSAPKAKSLH